MFHVGQPVWAAFPGQRVAAVITEVGVGEIRVCEIGQDKSEWIPEAWCQPRTTVD